MVKYAHSQKDAPVEKWQPLDEHLKNVAETTEDFASGFNSAPWGKLIGFLHDLGKSREAFQNYLLHSNGLMDADYDYSEHSHSGTGACYLKKAMPFGHFPAYCIAGHHAGLPDGSPASGASSLSARLKSETVSLDEADVRQWITEHKSALDGMIAAAKESFPWKFSSEDAALWVRMLFSCLVDADFLDTEKFMAPRTAAYRSRYPEIAELSETFFRNLDNRQRTCADTPVNRIRAEIRAACEKAAEAAPGIFSLTVPTGGGKTLSSTAFAFRHALKYEKRRIIYVIPYTSIIEQTSAVLREFLGENNVVEHHSNFDPDRETIQSSLASENWDAPVIVTTTVQFFESLFSCRSGRCRKLHNIVNSVVILDEVQLLPPSLLIPCRAAIRQLARHYGTTFILSTATQPNHGDLENVTEIIPEEMRLFRRLKRTEIEFPQDLSVRKSWDEVAAELRNFPQVLCIVNTRADCRELYEKMPPGTIHLSALMCGRHRSEVIAGIKQKLADHQEIAVVSTNLVEAGVDIDFPVVYRAWTGLASVMQSAGRCNREGRLSAPGKVFVFMPPKPSPIGDLRKAEDALTELLQTREGLSPDDPASYPRYFETFYGKINNLGTVFDGLLVSRVGEGILQFREADEKFRMIDDRYSRPLIVRYGEIDELIFRLRVAGPTVEIMRKLQRNVVNIPAHVMKMFLDSGRVQETHPGIFVQEDPDLYDDVFGVDMGNGGFEMKDLIL